MVRGLLLAATLATSAMLCAQAPTFGAAPSMPPSTSEKLPHCTVDSDGPCQPTNSSRKKAAKLFTRAQKEQKDDDLSTAFEDFNRVVHLAPDSFAYATAREFSRQQLVHQLLDTGNKQMLDRNTVQALATFRRALEIDPGNDFARQRIYDAMPPVPAIRVEKNPGTELVDLKPLQQRKHLVLQGPSSVVLETMAKAFGITAFVDPSVDSRQISITLDNVNWSEASEVVCRMTKTFWTPLAPNQALFAKEDDATRRALQRVGMMTFYVSTSTPQELTDLTNTLRVLFDIRFITANPANGTITIRAAQPVVEAAIQFIDQLNARQPQVIIDVNIYAVSRDLTRELGTDFPNSFTIFNVPTEAQKLLGGQSIQSVINQLIANGGINQAATAGIAGLLAQALGGGGSGSLLTSPFLTFGGGITLTGISTPGFSIKLSVNESMLHSLQHVEVRASHGNPATIKLGQRYPILNSSYAPIYNTPAIANVIANGSYLAPIPSFSYEDLGVNLKATPRVSRTGIVTVEVEMQIRALQGTSENGVPILSNREFKAAVSTRDGESIGVAGLISKSEAHDLTGVPFVSSIPVLGAAFTDRTNRNNDDEVLVVMTPHIVSGAAYGASPIIPLPSFIQR